MEGMVGTPETARSDRPHGKSGGVLSGFAQSCLHLIKKRGITLNEVNGSKILKLSGKVVESKIYK